MLIDYALRRLCKDEDSSQMAAINERLIHEQKVYAEKVIIESESGDGRVSYLPLNESNKNFDDGSETEDGDSYFFKIVSLAPEVL